jgi:hypothetical protein
MGHNIIELDHYRRPTGEDLPDIAKGPYSGHDLDMPITNDTVDVVSAERLNYDRFIELPVGQAVVRSFLLTMSDGTRYRVGTSENTDRDIALDVPVIRSDPLLTRHAGASRDRTINNLMAGWPVDRISVRQKGRRLSLDRMAHDQFVVSRWITELSHTEPGMTPRHESLIRLEGESRAAIISLAMAARALDYDYDVLNMNLEAPAAGERVTKETLRRDLAKLGINEITNFLGALRDSREREQTARNLGMVCRSLGSFNSYVGDVFTFAEGPGGEAAASVPHDTYGQITYYRDDKLQWEPYLAHFERQIDGYYLYPNITQAIRPGAHGSLASKAAVERQGQLVQELAERYRYGDLSVS